ncbi:hypothetical protein GCM10011309_05470 [Litorimonas cladophorae]|uniref:Uncharacterized protein n=1 Tax=Litorimonas cladophorae TaxID=1220491 RepID=A0A918NCW7_9PROT|nr:DUF2849 domain-containing protein [Litorimonas cladophorae]GGX58928.1 hypothetical protein GCM10011309_05470 [Litorimonas cladophorae]
MSTLKHKGKGPQSMTANELRDGFSVWLDENLDWTRDFSKALRTEDQDLIDRMHLRAETDEKSNLVVGIYFIDIEPDTGLPARYREKFRVNGPSYDTADLLETN